MQRWETDLLLIGREAIGSGNESDGNKRNRRMHEGERDE